MFVQAIRRAAQIRADAPATICGTRVRTWQESMERTARLAQALRGLGVRPNDRVGILASNSDRYLEAVHATWWCGAVTVPMNTRWSIAEHSTSIDDADIGVVFADDAFAQAAATLAESRASIRHVVHMGEQPGGAKCLSFERLIEENEPEPPSERSSHDLAGIFYTGGTTGLPKGVMHSAHSLWSGAMIIALDARVPDVPRYLHAAPMFHLGDLSQAFYCTALAGTHVFVPAFAPDAVQSAVRAHRVQVTLLVPTMLGMLLDSPAFDPVAFSSLELLVYGGSPMSDGLRARAQMVLPGARMVQGFGQTETNACGTMLHEEVRRTLEHRSDRHCAVGRASYGIEIAIFDSQGVPCAPGAVGEICIKSASAMLGYWNRSEETRQALAGGWVHTGDAGYLDERGVLYVCDRVKDMIISGGENVFSAEVENAIALHAAVAQAAVIGVPDDKWGERVHAVIILRSDTTLTLGELQEHCKAHIAGYKIPRSMELRTAPMPLSAAGKVLKRELRAPYWRNLARGVN